MSYARTFEKTILITGAAGFIGSNFVSHVYRRYPNYRLVLLDALTYAGSLENLPAEFNRSDSDQISFWYGNVCNAELVDTLVSQFYEGGALGSADMIPSEAKKQAQRKRDVRAFTSR